MIYKIKENRVSRTYLGGKEIDKFYDKDVCKDSYFPEDWTASDTGAYNANKSSTEGIGITIDGIPITSITNGEKLRILVKLLNSAERLVIQAHPTVSFAKKFLSSEFGKTECRYFLESAPDAVVYIGFKEEISKDDWERAFYNNDSEKMLSMLHCLPVKKGDFVFVDGGIPHAIGKGCFMVELQEPSDLMAVNERFTPSGREIAENRLHMGLGYEKMFDVYDYTSYSTKDLKKKYCPQKTEVSKGLYEICGDSITEKFKMYLLTDGAVLKESSKYKIAIVINGNGKLLKENVKKGDRLLLKEEQLLTAEGKDLEIIVCF